MQQIIDYLTSVHITLPWALLTLAIWLTQWAVRVWVPTFWERIANVPFPVDAGPAIKIARKSWQALPSVLSGAIVGAVMMGDDPGAAWLGAMAGFAAPIWHEVLKNLPGPYRGGKAPAVEVGE